MRSSFLVGFGVSMLSAMIGLLAPDAAAAYRRTFSPIACVSSAYNPTQFATISADGQLVNNTSSAIIDWCPVVSDSDLVGNYDATTATSLSVNAWSTAVNSVRLYECRTYASGFGGACGPGKNSVSSGAVETVTLTPSSAWSAG